MSGQVEQCELASGFSISRIITGMWQVADMERDGAILDLRKTTEAMKPYLDAGLSTFDMADHYGSAEEIAGTFAHDTEGIQLLTKWVPEPGPLKEQDVRNAVGKALIRTKRETIDLFQFHAWNYADPAWLEALFFLNDLKQEGLISHLGLTNFDGAHLGMVVHSGIQVVSNQVSYSLIDQRPVLDMTELCQEQSVRLLAYGTLAGGFLSERWLDKPEPKMRDLKTWSQMKYKRFIDAAGGWDKFQQLLQVVKNVAIKGNVSMANVACRFVLDQPEVGGIIVGARLGESEHIQENLRVFQFSLDDESRAVLEEATSLLTPIPGNCGDEYRKPPFLTASGDLSHHVEAIPPPYETRSGGDGRTLALSGTAWESMAGYSRAVRKGDRIWVSGTTAAHGERLIGGKDPASQTHFIIDKIGGAIQSLGGTLANVVRTRVFISNIEQWEAVARAHGERFREILPANTLVQASLVGEKYLVEMEAEAHIRSD